MSERLLIELTAASRSDARKFYLDYINYNRQVNFDLSNAYHKLDGYLSRMESELDKLDRFIERNPEFQQCGSCGEWCFASECDDCQAKAKICNKCSGTGGQPLGPDDLSQSVCRSCKGKGEVHGST